MFEQRHGCRESRNFAGQLPQSDEKNHSPAGRRFKNWKNVVCAPINVKGDELMYSPWGSQDFFGSDFNLLGGETSQFLICVKAASFAQHSFCYFQYAGFS